MVQERQVYQGDDAYAPLHVLGAPGGTLVIGNASIGLSEVLLRSHSDKRRSIIIQNRGAGKIAIGPSGVSTTNAPTVDSGASMVLDKGAGAAIYAIADGAGYDVRWVEESNE